MNRTERVRKISSLLQILFYILAALSFYKAILIACYIIGAFVGNSPDMGLTYLIRILPLLTVFLGIAHTMKMFGMIRKNLPGKTIRRRAITAAVHGILGMILFLVCSAADGNKGFIPGIFDTFEPWDVLVFSTVITAAALIVMKRERKTESADKKVPAAGISAFFTAFLQDICLFFALPAFAAALILPFTADWRNHGLFCIALLLLLLQPSVYLCAWEFGCEKRETPGRRNRLCSAVIGLVCTLAVCGLFIAAFISDPLAADQACPATMPVDSLATLNIIIIYMPVDLIIAAAALVSAVSRKKR